MRSAARTCYALSRENLLCAQPREPAMRSAARTCYALSRENLLCAQPREPAMRSAARTCYALSRENLLCAVMIQIAKATNGGGGDTMVCADAYKERETCSLFWEHKAYEGC